MQLFLVTLALLILSLATANAKSPVEMPLPGASVEEYLRFQTKNLKHKLQSDIPTSPYVGLAASAGSKNFKWLEFMNSTRKPEDKIVLTRVGDLPQYPIEAPSKYGPSTIERDYLKIQSEIPQAMRDVVFGDAAFTPNPPLEMDEYIFWARKVNRMYEEALRWDITLQYFDMFIASKTQDIRGYYYLQQEKNLKEELENWSSLRRKDKIRLKFYLLNQCGNSKANEKSCQNEFRRTKSHLWDFYQKYLPIAKAVYDSNFIIQDADARKDLQWTEENKMRVPFQSTEASIQDFLSFNLEDEWKWEGWNLRLNFTPDAQIRVDFQVGVLPHVAPEDVNVIVMDQNSPLTEWNTQLAIRHEFGHILGFPDCYVEFYEPKEKLVIAYQLDVTNMMCSRAGRMKEVLYKELKRVYYKPSVSN